MRIAPLGLFLVVVSCGGPSTPNTPNPSQHVTPTEPDAAAATTAPSSASRLSATANVVDAGSLEAGPADGSSVDEIAWTSRCERELKAARGEAAKLYPRLGNDEVRSRAATATEGARVSFVGEADHEHFGTFVEYGSRSTRSDARHPAWVDLSDAEMHSKGHWTWVRDYDRGRGAIYFDDSQFVRADPRMTKVFAILRKAVDRCFEP